MLSHLAVTLALAPHFCDDCVDAKHHLHTGKRICMVLFRTDELATIWSSLCCRLAADVRRGASQFAEKLSLLEVPQPALPDKVRVMAAG